MPWNPDTYNKFTEERQQPFFDLISHVKKHPDSNILDLGCGTGELTVHLASEFSNPTVLAIDTSAEMLANSPTYDKVTFTQRSIQDQLADTQLWDIIVANASLQWIDHHTQLIPSLVSKLNEGGQLAIQMPCQEQNVLNHILLELVQKEPFASALNHFMRVSPVLSIDEYAHLLFESGSKDLVIYQKMYPIIVQKHDDLYDFIAGSTLIPYFERLPSDMHHLLTLEFKNRIQARFPSMPAIYAFKRLIIYAQF